MRGEGEQKSVLKGIGTVLGLLLALLGFLWGVISNAETWASNKIRDVIEKEARICFETSDEKKASAVAEIYCAKAVVCDWGDYLPGGQHPRYSWRGLDQITRRYCDLPSFSYLRHIDIDVSEMRLLSGTARARSSTEGQLAESHGIASFDSDRWSFRKEGGVFWFPWTGEWKIDSFIYGREK